MDDETPASAAASAAASASASTAAWWSGATAVGSSSASGPARFVLNLPPGYHFLPTHAELVVHYLRPRLANHQLPLPIFFDECILDYRPDRLIEKYREYGEDRWFFFTRRQRKHAGGSRPNRATPDNGHWNATGSPRQIRHGSALVGCLRTLVFYEASPRKKNHGLLPLPPPPPLLEEKAKSSADKGAKKKGKSNKGVKTEWTMYEYESVTSEEEFVAAALDGNAKMDAIVLCTIQKKKNREEGETKKRTRSKTKPVEESSCGVGNKKPRKMREHTADQALEEDHAQRAFMELETEPAWQEPEVEYHPQRFLMGTEAMWQEAEVQFCTAVTNNFLVDPNASMFPCFASTLPPMPTLATQETVMSMMASGARGHNHTSVHPSAAVMQQHAMKKPQLQAAPPTAAARDFLLPSWNSNMLAPVGGANNGSIATAAEQSAGTRIDGHLASETAPPPPPLLEEPPTSWICPPHMLHNTTKTVPAAELQLCGFGPAPVPCYSNNGGLGGIEFLDLSSFPFPLQPPFYGALLHDRVNVNHQIRAASGTEGSSPRQKN